MTTYNLSPANTATSLIYTGAIMTGRGGKPWFVQADYDGNAGKNWQNITSNPTTTLNMTISRHNEAVLMVFTTYSVNSYRTVASVSGLGLSWSQLDQCQLHNSGVYLNQEVWYAFASTPTSGTVTITPTTYHSLDVGTVWCDMIWNLASTPTISHVSATNGPATLTLTSSDPAYHVNATFYPMFDQLGTLTTPTGWGFGFNSSTGTYNNFSGALTPYAWYPELIGIAGDGNLALSSMGKRNFFGGTGFVSGDIGSTVTVSGGTFTTAAQGVITGVSGGAITGLKLSNPGLYSVLPSGGTVAPITGGSGTGAQATFSSIGTNAAIITNGGGFSTSGFGGISIVMGILADCQTFLLSCNDGVNGTFNNDTKFLFQYLSTTLRVAAWTSANSLLVDARFTVNLSSVDYQDDPYVGINTQHKLLFSLDTSGSHIVLYVDGSQITPDSITWGSSGLIGNTSAANWNFGIGEVGTNWDVGFTALWINPAYLDFTNSANRNLFAVAYFGVQPDPADWPDALHWFYIQPTGIPDDFQTNKGYGGAWSWIGTASHSIAVSGQALLPNDNWMCWQRGICTLLAYAFNDEFWTDYQTPYEIDLWTVGIAGTARPYGDPFYTIITPPTHGHVDVGQGFFGYFVYFPDNGFSGTDSFVYQITDNMQSATRCTNPGYTQQATITINVAPPPTTGEIYLGDLTCIETIPPDLRDVTLRWSDDGGASWSNGLLQSLGNIGEYNTSVQYRRLGMSRNRVFEVSWSGSQAEALQGVTIHFEIAKT